MRDQDEIYEAATEEPATLGCPSLVPGTVVVHDEPGTETLAELQRKGEQLKACNDRSYAKMVRIAELANECVLKTTHAEYAPGQYGQDYREFGKAMGEICELVGKSLSERFAPGEAAVDKAATTKEWIRKHYSFCDGIFPIRRANCEKAVIEHCWICGRRFTMEMSSDIHDDGEHVCCAKIRDNGKLIAKCVVYRGKSIAEKMAHGTFKAYVRNLSGAASILHAAVFSNRHSSAPLRRRPRRPGRWRDGEVGCKSQRPLLPLRARKEQVLAELGRGEDGGARAGASSEGVHGLHGLSRIESV